jgi:hypothetical protein
MRKTTLSGMPQTTQTISVNLQPISARDAARLRDMTGVNIAACKKVLFDTQDFSESLRILINYAEEQNARLNTGLPK